MSSQKKISARDISRQFGIPVTEKDLQPEVSKDNAFASQLASLEDLIELETSPAGKNASEKSQQSPTNACSSGKQSSRNKVFVEECKESFADLYEKHSPRIPESSGSSQETAKHKGSSRIKDLDGFNEQEKQLKIHSSEDDSDFGKYFNMASAKVSDKDSIELSEEEAEPFEISEEAATSSSVRKQTFHTFAAFEEAFSTKNKRSSKRK